MHQLLQPQNNANRFLSEQQKVTYDEQNPGWIENTTGGISPIAIGNHLYFVKSGDVKTTVDEGTGSYFLRMSLDGTKKERIDLTFGIVFDGENFYF